MRVCSVTGCTKNHKSKGMCDTHRKQILNRDKKEFLAAQKRTWRLANPSKAPEACRRYRSVHPDRIKRISKAYRENNAESIKQGLKRYQRANLHYFRESNARRRGVEKRATPSWADLKSIKEFYRCCPSGYHVDHIVPLNGRNVCGLHILGNLQYLPARENLKKGNRFNGA